MQCNCEFCFIGQIAIDLREKNKNTLYVSEVTEINHNHLLEILFMLHGSQIAQTIVSTERWETVAMVPRALMKWLNKTGMLKFQKLLIENVSVPLFHLTFPLFVPSYMLVPIRLCQDQLCMSETLKPLYNVMKIFLFYGHHNSCRIMMILEL